MNATIRHPALALLLALGPLAACSDTRESARDGTSEPVPVSAASAPAGDLETALALGIPYAHAPAEDLLTSGQITPAQMDALARAGYTTFVSLRLPTEEGAGWEEAYAAARGLAFTRIPVSGAAGLTRENAGALDRVLGVADTGKTVVYCGSANRVGALLALRAHWLQGVPPEEAMILGKEAGLTRLEPDVARLLAAGTR